MREISDTTLIFSPKNLVFKKANDYFVVLNPDIPNFMVVDDVGKSVFELCDGTCTLPRILKCINDKYPSQETRREELAEFISSLAKAGLLYIDSSPPQTDVVKWEKLHQLYLHLTHECNLRCKHCYANADLPLKNEMTTPEYIRLIREFVELGGEQLILTGGEPFLRRSLLYQILPVAKDYGLKTFVESNGTLITRNDAAFCKKHDAKVGVSLDGVNKNSHQYIRGAGTFNRSVESIKILAQNGVRTTIGMTLMSHNVEEAKKMVLLAEKLGAAAVSYSVLRVTGRSKKNPELAVPIEKLVSAFREARKTGIEVGVKTGLEDIFSEAEGLQKRSSCGVGVGLISVASDGNVYPCNMFQAEGMQVGNVKEQSLGKIWKSDALKVFREFTVLDIPECRECELRFMCSNCPGDSYSAYKNIKKPSPLCSLYKALYWDIITGLAFDLWKKA